MLVVNVHEAKTNLSRLLARAEAGEEIVIARSGTPVARLEPVRKPAKRQFGSMADQIQIGDSFFEPLAEEELARWEGR